ncbi:MAG: glycosyltransferase [Desulfococcaceae bacterium]
MKICDVVQSYSPTSGGVKRYISNKMRCFAERSEIRHVTIVPWQENRVDVEHNTRIYRVRSPHIPGSVDYRLLMNRKRIYDIVESVRPDILEVDSAYLSSWIAIGAARQMSIPVVAYYHSDFPRRLSDKLGPCSALLAGVLDGMINRYLIHLYRRMDATVTATREFQKILQGMGVKPVVRIPLGVNTEKFYPRDSRKAVFQELGLSEDTFLLLYAGRLAGMKNLDHLFAMMDLISGDNDRYHLALVGDGELREEVVRAARERKDISWIPYRSSRDELARWYSAADLFVHAGTRETFGLVSLEAQACGTRVIGVRGGGMEETLYRESPLIMAENERPDALARAVQQARKLAETETDRQRRRHRILENFSWENTFRRMAALYAHLCNGFSADTFTYGSDDAE